MFLSSLQVAQFSEGPLINTCGGYCSETLGCKSQGAANVNLWRDCSLTQDIFSRMYCLEGGGGRAGDEEKREAPKGNGIFVP